jgi:mono/diheme cytochrome c family protein
MLASHGASSYEPYINYALHCMGCHTPDGSGTPDRVPAVRDTLLPLARLPDGRRYLVQVPGSAQSTLTNAELAAVLNWMIGTFSGNKEFTQYTESEVARYRSQTLVQVRAERERLLGVGR